jgi:hypothetical protein
MSGRSRGRSSLTSVLARPKAETLIGTRRCGIDMARPLGVRGGLKVLLDP